MRSLRTAFAAMLQSGKVEDAALLDVLFDRSPADPARLPQTGIGEELERQLGAIFVGPISIKGRAYGTRASTLAYARDDGSLVLRERRFDSDATVAGETRIEL